MKLQKGSANSITCPECGKNSAIPTGAIKLLPSNFFINRIIDEIRVKKRITEQDVRCDLCVRTDPAVVLCFDCGVFLCHHCYESHKYSKEYQGHGISQLKELGSEKKDLNVRLKTKPPLCQEHDMELNFYCGTCDQLVCHYCITADHNGHEHNTVKKVATGHRVELDDIIKPVEEMVDKLSKAHQKVNTAREKVEMQVSKLDKQIDDYYDQLQRRLQQQKEELKEELHEVTTQKRKALSLQLEQMEHTQGKLQSIKELHSAIKGGSDQEALFMKKQVAKDVKRMTDVYKKLNTEAVELATMQFVQMKEYQDSFPQFTCVFFDDADPPTKNTKDDHCPKGVSKVIAQVKSSIEDVIPVAAENNQDSNYSASLIPKQVEEVKLSVFNGRHIQGSPSVSRNYCTLSVPNKMVDDSGRMGRPWGIAFGKDGVWAVTDTSNHCVYIFDSEDQVVTKFGGRGNGNSQFKFPRGIAFDADNYLYVADKDNN